MDPRSGVEGPDQTADQTEARWTPSGLVRVWFVEATTGFEPVNRGFADLRVEPLHHVAPCDGRTHRGDQSIVAAPRGFEPRFTDSKSAVLPLDEGAAGGDLERTRAVPGPGMPPGQKNGAEDGTRTRDPHLGKVMLYQLSHFRSNVATTDQGGAESQNRTGDTAIFSRVLYQLSYLGPMANQALAAHWRPGEYHGALPPFKVG